MTNEESLIYDAVVNARKIQGFLLNEQDSTKPLDVNHWVQLFQKRVDKISEIDSQNPSAIIELRKRLLQQAALSIKALNILQTRGVKDEEVKTTKRGSIK